MWIVSVDVNYYPYILKFKTEEEARKRYTIMLKGNEKDGALFLAEVKDHILGSDYEIEYDS